MSADPRYRIQRNEWGWRPRRLTEGLPASVTPDSNALFNRQIQAGIDKLRASLPVKTLKDFTSEEQAQMKAALEARETARRNDPDRLRAAEMERQARLAKRRRR